MLPRALARRLSAPSRRWPARLRTKWPAIVLFVLVLFAYELFDLWGDPWWTGVLILGYFASALCVDLVFRAAPFCKYVCPIGQFNFLASTLSPLEVAVRDAAACARCTTRECIRGPAGCEMDLYLPRKVDNLDCTFCLDCVHACPHDNIGVLVRVPAEALATDRTRSGIGRLGRRADWTALIIAFVFGGLLNAFAMIAPVFALERAIARATGLRAEWPILALIFVAALVVAPLALVGGAAALSRRWARLAGGRSDVAHAFARSLIPLGFGVWLAHYGFHFLTGALTVIPVVQLAVRDLAGWPAAGEPQWQLGGLPERVVFPIELGFLVLGLAGSWFVAARIAADLAPRAAGRAFVPWGALCAVLFAAAVWIMSQPMDMRGTFLGA